MRETTRPTIYRVMKYWGKKPHNIWSSYIKKYSKKGDCVLDPFVGSGMTYFESIKCSRNPITIDINPISDLCIDCFTKRNINYKEVTKTAKKIIENIKNIDCYENEYLIKCSNCGEITDIYNYKKNVIQTISYKCRYCNKIITEEIKKNQKIYNVDKWVPNKKLSKIESISESFIKKIGNDDISAIWSNKNLKILSEIYDLILKIEDESEKEILVFAFIQCLHLTSKMCIPRSDKSNRPLSTSWGRPAYMLSDKVFEQNPVLAFEKAVFNSTGVIKGLKSSEKYIGSVTLQSAKHYLGDSLTILKKIDNKKIDLVITDPPYGSIIQYGDLSEVWVSWLERYNKEYKIDHKSEIIVNKNKNQKYYENQLTNTFKELNRVLKDDGTFVLTFNSNCNDDWKSLLTSIKESGFYVHNFVLQKNKRSSEANVSAKKGIAISDYYLICKKGNWNIDTINKFLIEKRIDLNG